MIVARDAVADRSRDTHEAELKILARAFADVKTTDEVMAMLAGVTAAAPQR
jgi:isochorismate hydrolase